MARRIRWTQRETLTELKTALKEIAQNKEIKSIESSLENKPYSVKRLREAVREWEATPSINALWEKITETLENRLVIHALTNKTNANFTQFVLKNCYNWKDKQEVEHSHITQVINEMIQNAPTPLISHATSDTHAQEPPAPEPRRITLQQYEGGYTPERDAGTPQ